MKAPAMPLNESSRLSALRSLRLLDTAAEERFDRWTRLARCVFNVPISLITLVDAERQWFKSREGVSVSETPRDISFCGHAILGNGIFMVPDATSDARFCANPLVTDAPRIRFYVGRPLALVSGHKIGTLCLIDVVPRVFTLKDQQSLDEIASMVEQEIVSGHHATMDELTALSNRRGFRALGQHAINICKREGTAAALLFFDLNGFKAINDEFGHSEGDRVLKRFGETLRRVFRESDVIGRLGGDEFAVLLTDARLRETENALGRLDDAMAELNLPDIARYRIAFSVGVTKLDHERERSIDDLIRDADSMMYQHKKNLAKAKH